MNEDDTVFLALRNIAADAETLKDDLRRSAKRCHRAVCDGTPDDECRQDEFNEYLAMARGLYADVAGFLPDVAKSLRQLTSDCSRLAREDYSKWPALESELRNVAVDARHAMVLRSLRDHGPQAEPLTDNDRSILVAMLELDATPEKPEPAATIVQAALGRGDPKHAFDRLKPAGLVATKKGPFGYWLTDKGRETAGQLK